MHTFLLAVHVVFAVFAVGPLVGAVSAAPRALRGRDGPALSGVARSARIYAYASVLVALVGFGLMATGRDKPTFRDTWIWLSILLWLAAVVVVLVVLVPAVRTAARRIGAGGSVSSLTGRIAGCSGVITVFVTVIIFLMVYRP
jgi:Predicted integral membrane protein (DUF2269)